jgi:uncharacterized membrane protein YbhN (UPF0104 family)
MRRRLLSLALLLVAVAAMVLVYRTLSRFSIADVQRSLSDLPRDRLAAAALCAAASYAALICYDVLALHHVGAKISIHKIALASFCSMSIAHNVGFASLSSGAVRYRFYSRWGVRVTDVARIIVFCASTTLLGLTVFLGATFLVRPELAAEVLGVSRSLISFLGWCCLALAAGYAGAASVRLGPLRLGQFTLALPRPKVALAQIMIGGANFALIAGALANLVGGSGVDYATVAGAFALSLIASFVAHVPGGLGVLEATMVALLPADDVIGGLVAHRLIYFLVPGVLGAATMAIVELRRRSVSHRAGQGSQPR